MSHNNLKSEIHDHKPTAFTFIELLSRDYDHRHSDRIVAAGGAGGTRGGTQLAMRR